LGFDPPDTSPNYAQVIKIERYYRDIGYAVRLGFRALKQVYRVSDFGSGTFKTTIP
jgi:hypothetical protein